MRKRIGWIAAAVLALVGFILYKGFVGYLPMDYTPDRVVEEKKMKTGILEMGFGDRGDDVVKRSSFAIKRAGVSTALLYEADSGIGGVDPILRFKQGANGFDLPAADYILFYDDAEDTRGIENIQVEIKLPHSLPKNWDAPALEAYDRAVYALVFDIIRRINTAGWPRYIDISAPRIAGLETLALEGGLTRFTPYYLNNADPLFTPTFEQWRHLPYGSVGWQWLMSNVSMLLDYHKGDRTPGGSVRDTISLSIMRPDAGAKIPAAEYEKIIPKSLAERHAEETKARAAGVRILEDWVDPPLNGVTIPKN